jgi:sugar-specific transcriptional regulator TrmB
METLQKAGLTIVESKTYVALLELGLAKASELSTYAKIPTSNLYGVLESLSEKGLVSYSLQNNVKIYQASNPDALKLLFDKEVEKIKLSENEVLQTISELKIRKSIQEKQAGFRYFESHHGLRAMWLELIDTMDANQSHKIHVGNPKAYQNLEGFYNLYHDKRKKLQIPTQMIFDSNDKKLADARKSAQLEIKFQKTNSECEWGIIDNKFFMQHKDKAFLIEDTKFVETFSKMFDTIWNSIK